MMGGGRGDGEDSGEEDRLLENEDYTSSEEEEEEEEGPCSTELKRALLFLTVVSFQVESKGKREAIEGGEGGGGSAKEPVRRSKLLLRLTSLSQLNIW